VSAIKNMATPLVAGDDGLLAEEVGEWIKDKHAYLRAYLDISSGTRAKYLGDGPRKGGATFVDLFCSVGRAKIRDKREYVAGSPVVAWNCSVERKAAFSNVFIADIDAERRAICAHRLAAVKAPVVELLGAAVEAAEQFVAQANPYGLHFAFLDPHNLGSLDFRIIKSLSSLKRIDMLIHVSAMDLQRNIGAQLGLSRDDTDQFDAFAPGWRQKIDTTGPKHEVRRRVVEYWTSMVAELGVAPSSEARLIKGSRGQRLYWLMLSSRHSLAKKFWSVIGRSDGQGELL
jgi:three-Cys-motif partner protein